MCGFVREAGHFFVFYIVILFTSPAIESFFRLVGTIILDHNVAARLAAVLITTIVVCVSSSNPWAVEPLINIFRRFWLLDPSLCHEALATLGILDKSCSLRLFCAPHQRVQRP